MQGITKRYSADFTDMARSLMKHHYDCMKNLYPGDTHVEELYKNYRVISLLLDSMKLNFFHPDNPNPKSLRKQDFLAFIDSEPFKSAVNDFDLENFDWWGWRVPISLAKRKKFDTLDFFFKHENALKIYGALNSRFIKVKRLIKKA